MPTGSMSPPRRDDTRTEGLEIARALIESSARARPG
jgi:hypothetical protein